MEFTENNIALNSPEEEVTISQDAVVGRLVAAETVKTVEVTAIDRKEAIFKYEPARTSAKFKNKHVSVPERGSFKPRFGSDLSLPLRFEK